MSTDANNQGVDLLLSSLQSVPPAEVICWKCSCISYRSDGVVFYRASREVLATARRMTKHGSNYFQFITSSEIEPTNNLAEQALRFVVIDRYITQGTHGEKDQRWCERFGTVLASCQQQNRNAMQFITAATNAWAKGRPAGTVTVNQHHGDIAVNGYTY